MRNLLITLLLATFGLAASAQDYYPLPSTQVYGELVVDSSFFNLNDEIYLINDTLDLSPVPLVTRFAGTYEWRNNNFSAAGYFPDGFGTSIPSYSVRVASGDTVAELNLFKFANAVGQLISFQSTMGNGTGKIGYETQIDAGVNTAKMFATNYDGSSNLCVVEVDTFSVRIKSETNKNVLHVTPTRTEIESIQAFFYPPRMTGAQADAVASVDVDEGAMVFITTTNATFLVPGLYMYISGSWVLL